MALRVGVLDQSPVISGHTPARALAETVALARLAEDLGYHRYWLAEQHAADELMLITITGDYESRKQSYRLLAKALGLQMRPPVRLPGS